MRHPVHKYAQIYFISIVLGLSVLTASSQPGSTVIPLSQFNGDTTAYVRKNFVQNKARYLHKPLSVLINDLGIPVVSYFPGGIGNDARHFNDMMLSFYPRVELHRRLVKHQRPLIIRVEFDSLMIRDSAKALIRAGHGAWLDAEKEFYAGRRVGDIQIGGEQRRKGPVEFPKVDSLGRIVTY